MDHVVAVPLDASLAAFIGKKGSQNGITFYNRLYNGSVIAALAPTSIEEKFYSVAESMLLAHQIVISTASIDKLFGEVVVATSLLNKKVLFTDDNDVSKIVGNLIPGYEVCSKDSILDKITGYTYQGGAGGARIDIDKAFVVKGVGTVVLGIVTKGSVKVHDELFHSSGGKVVVKSIQSQDRDIQEAGIGTRVGLALKGMTSDEIGKGDVIAGTRIEPLKKVNAEIRLAGMPGLEIARGKTYGFVSNFSYTNAVVAADGSLDLDRPVPLEKGDAFLLMQEQAPRIFASGRVL